MDRKSKRARSRRAGEIQAAIRRELLEWNLIGFPVPEDEYDFLIAPVFRLLTSRASVEQLAAALGEMEQDLGLAACDLETRLQVGERLRALDVRLRRSSEVR